MINEMLFFVHIIIITLFTIIALHLGKEALIAIISIFCILANLFVLKQITLFGLHPTAADAFSVGAIIGLNLLQEYFGKNIAKKTVWICFFSLILYIAVSQIHLAYIPSVYDVMASHYAILLQFMPRISIASILVTLFVLQLDRIFYGFLKEKLQGRYFVIRSIVSVIIMQLIDTVLFSFIGLYGIIGNIWDIILVSLAVKLATIAISVPLISFFKPRISLKDKGYF